MQAHIFRIIPLALSFFFSACVVAEAIDVEQYIKEVLQDKSIPAMAVLMIEEGKIKKQFQQGVQAIGEPTPVAPDELWHIGSNGKAMTATLMARLVEKKLINWETTLADVFPELVANMNPAYQKVTIEDLLSHRAGLAPNADEQWLESTYLLSTSPVELRKMYAAKVLAVAPAAPIKADSNYSNSGAILCATIAEKLTGKTFEQLIDEEVFSPLGMTVGFGPTPDNQNAGHKEGKPVRGYMASNPKVMIPAGDMYMTMEDWAKFVIDQMSGEQGKGKLLNSATYVKLHTAQGNTAAALGWGVRNDYPAGSPVRLLAHAGSNGYWNAVVTVAPDQLKALLMVINAGDGTNAEAYEMNLAKEVFK